MKFYVTGFEDIPEILDYMSKKDNNCIVEVTIKKDKRTIPQNKLYWTNIEIISKETWYTIDEVHELIKSKFLEYTKKSKNGIENTFTRTTTSLDTKEFSELMEKVYKLWKSQWFKMKYPDELYK